MKKLTELPQWQDLQAHFLNLADADMRTWFQENPQRFNEFSRQFNGIFFDFSKNRITAETVQLLLQLAKAAELTQKIAALFAGNPVNSTEKRAALHMALRDPRTEPLLINGKDIKPEIHATLEKMRSFTTKVRTGEWKGSTGKVIQDIVNIGIGGSHLGPEMAIHALGRYAHPGLRYHSISNVDSAHLHAVLQRINPETALFIISSKTFTTVETLTNAKTIRTWLQDQLGPATLQNHFIAVTARAQRAIEFGILPENIFPLWDWVGGRYSIWSAIGLPLALLIGMEKFNEFLQGAHEMDQHFQHAPLAENIPVILGLLGIWYINFFGIKNLAIAPYAHALHYLRAYIQQLDMESNGKSISQQGWALDHATGPVIIGEQGCNGQHAYHQLLHQGPDFIPVDFILVAPDKEAHFKDHAEILISSALSQAQALLQGKSYEQALAELITTGYSQTEAEFLAKHKAMPGNRPSNVLFLQQMTPHNLGALLALYEHKVFVQGAIWDINSFDQWGVELGKELLPQILTDLTADTAQQKHDSSTRGLIQHYKNVRDKS